MDAVCVTTRRLFESDPQYFSEFQDVVIDIKIGIDGARSNTHYSHFFADEKISDHNFLIASFVLLGIKSGQTTIYLNPKPCSDLFTRPIYFSYETENVDNINNAINKFKLSLSNPANFSLFHNGEQHEINFFVNFSITMIDGKVSNFLVGNKATLRCPVCFLTSNGYADITPTSFDHSDPKIQERLKLCINPLHSSFKLFDFLLKMSRSKALHNFSIQNSDSTKKDRDEFMKTFINQYERQFWRMTKAQVDFIKPGYGKSTTGPNVNRAMKSPQICAEILDLDEKFVTEVSKLSNYLNSLEPVNESDWQGSACYVFNFYCENFSNFANLSPSVHKILCHGLEMIKILEKAPGVYSEQSQEKINKKFRDLRDCHSRKIEFKSMLEDIFTFFYVNTDPLIFKNELF